MQLLLLCTAVVYRIESYLTRKCPPPSLDILIYYITISSIYMLQLDNIVGTIILIVVFTRLGMYRYFGQ